MVADTFYKIFFPLVPELPEVEIVRRGIAPVIVGQTIDDVIVRERRLRLPVTPQLRQKTRGQQIREVRRRGKYLLIDLEGSVLIIHLGMSGTLYFSPKPPTRKHEHIGWKIGDVFLIYNDPRRFGCVVWSSSAPETHPLLCLLGPEPLSPTFDGIVLRQALKNKRTSIKTALLNGHIVVGVGNIYASESLHKASIHPQTPAHRIGNVRSSRLADSIKIILHQAIDAGGSTIRNFTNVEQASGYFQVQWQVYGRGGQPCTCGGTVRQFKQNGRSTYYCPRCQR